MCFLQHPADSPLGMDWCGKSGALLCRQLNLEVHLQVMLTISCQLIVCLRCQSAGEYELAAIKKSSIGWGVGMSELGWNFWQILHDPVTKHHDDHSTSWIWESLVVAVQRWLLWEALWGGQKLEKAGPYFLEDPQGRCSCWGRGQSQECCWGAGAVETAWAAPNSCGCALPAAFQIVLLQRLHFLSWSTTCSGNVHSLNGQIHIIRNFR